MVESTPGRRNGGLAAAILSTAGLPTSMGRLSMIGGVRFGQLRQIFNL